MCTRDLREYCRVCAGCSFWTQRVFLRSAPQARAGPGLRRAERLYTALWAREKGGKIQRLSRALGGLAEALRGVRAPCRVHLLDTS